MVVERLDMMAIRLAVTEVCVQLYPRFLNDHIVSHFCSQGAEYNHDL